jgi:hypothetical protein
MNVRFFGTPLIDPLKLSPPYTKNKTMLDLPPRAINPGRKL